MAVTFDTTNIDKTISVANDPGYRKCIMTLNSVPYPAGSGAGQPVVVEVIFNPPLPFNTINLAMIATPSTDCVATVPAKSIGGCNLLLNPRVAANTVTAGTVDVAVFWDLP